jgi:glycosyltransferase involved in cell wall biosynthesis
MLRFPEAPALCTCHSRRTDLSAALAMPQVRRWIAVDGPCRERLVEQCGIAPECVRWIPNFVDLERFAPRGPLPARPKRALLFGRFKSEWSAMNALLAAVEAACARTGMTLERVGPGIGPVELAPERVLPRFDLIFARGRSALEALAVGAAVVVTSAEGFGPLVTSDDLDRLRLLNFGGAATEPVWNADVLVRTIRGYDAADAAAVTARIRKEQSAEAVVGSLVAAYQEAVADHRAAGVPAPVAVARAAAPAVLRARGRIGGLRLRLQGEGRPPDRRRRLRFLLARLARLGRRPR